MNIMERMMGLMMERTSKEDKEAMMDSMMEKFFADITPEEKQKMMSEMMPKMMEGMDMMDMMPRMMMGMMSGTEGNPSEGMQGIMSSMMQGESRMNMADMMCKMMPNCIGMMLPSIDVEKRSEAASTILSAIIENGTKGMTGAQKESFYEVLGEVLHPAT